MLDEDFRALDCGDEVAGLRKILATGTSADIQIAVFREAEQRLPAIAAMGFEDALVASRDDQLGELRCQKALELPHPLQLTAGCPSGGRGCDR